VTGPEGNLEHLVSKFPQAIPPGRLLVHNHRKPTRQLGSSGFRAYLAPSHHPRVEPCDCGWAPELGDHYRFARARTG